MELGLTVALVGVVGTLFGISLSLIFGLAD